jgi:DNA invertase Pin-like site-specific DNA recombinase
LFIRAYLRASTTSQDALRAKSSLIEFANSKGMHIASFYVEHESGRKLIRPRLMELLADASKGDIILVESIDRLTRLTSDEWSTLKLMILQKGLHITALDLPTSHIALENNSNDDIGGAIVKAVNDMLIDILASIACKDYEQRRIRSAQGIAKAKENGKYTGRPENIKRNKLIKKMLNEGFTYSEIQDATKASRATIAKVKKSTDSID